MFDERREFGIELEGFGLEREQIYQALRPLRQKGAYASVGEKFNKRIWEWVIAQDSTIKQPYPLELISPALNGVKGLRQIKRICDVLNKLEIQTNENCGLHVHWSAGDFTGRHMINLLRLYGKYEKILDFIFPLSRRDDQSPFAHSLLRDGSTAWLYREGVFRTHAYQLAKDFEKTQATTNTSSYPTARHHKVNICAYNKYRTVEFRQHEGTFDFEKIKNWIVFSQQLINRAKDTSVTEGVATWESLIKTLALTEPQLRESMDSPDKVYLREARDFYQKIYRENKKELETNHAVYLGS